MYSLPMVGEKANKLQGSVFFGEEAGRRFAFREARALPTLELNGFPMFSSPWALGRGGAGQGGACCGEAALCVIKRGVAMRDGAGSELKRRS